MLILGSHTRALFSSACIFSFRTIPRSVNQAFMHMYVAFVSKVLLNDIYCFMPLPKACVFDFPAVQLERNKHYSRL